MGEEGGRVSEPEKDRETERDRDSERANTGNFSSVFSSNQLEELIREICPPPKKRTTYRQTKKNKGNEVTLSLAEAGERAMEGWRDGVIRVGR